ncbi:hypothetical protein SAMN02799631_00399 [Methylobacterium sp. 174MFSha1.1]|uniref:hypothetical protein n=1 Tax=Methylobacterium sp. 174MFSha1.1 TaxID=1502749 RepID=UPI0008DF74FF|nr:hypothetical protein [Methylobacterium sp. 174MFSha1.1]SFU39048.1 hypothetical protein SAMN02799631_00399 [Methylobacterium sp. 174MFSha1.1]
MPIRIPSRTDITDDTPLRLEAAAALGWPAGGMTVAALRREIASGRLAAEFLAGKHWTTLAAIRELRERCRVQVTETVPVPRMTVAAGRSEAIHESAALTALERLVSTPIKRGAGLTMRGGRGAYSKRGVGREVAKGEEA